MKRLLLCCFAFLHLTSLSAQDDSVPPPRSLDDRALPHINVIKGRDNPGAIPIHEVTLTMLASYSGDTGDGSSPPVDRFAHDFNVDSVLAEAMVQAIRQVQSELDSANLARMKEFCAGSFSNQDAWLASVTAFDAESLIDRVAAFSKLRDVAGSEAWRSILSKAQEASRWATMVHEDHAAVAADIGYQVAFSNQCRDTLEKRQ
jgi:hypothetical protein